MQFAISGDGILCYGSGLNPRDSSKPAPDSASGKRTLQFVYIKYAYVIFSSQ